MSFDSSLFEKLIINEKLTLTRVVEAAFKLLLYAYDKK